MSVHGRMASFPRIKWSTEDNQLSEAKQFAQYTVLDEMPGLVFGLMTLVYIVSSLWSLA
jgi:hypothetical protein